ncbi:MAG: bleomycin resistance protein [Actinophytocola sp.]|uniref:VOC family protein n=1 Tax=Actinophytocola sp. TaxID=1872138 RepID=UPI001324C308|nr:VOC family protein [Actinophytocola sp.]MPZ80940.1 bleomycin resistance protein [Actinophytocola sp.]
MIIPAVRYDDPDKAVAWLVEAFGLTEHTVYRDEQGKVGHAELRAGDDTVMVSGPRDPGWLGGAAANPLASPISVYVVVDDPRSHFDRAKAAGAAIVRDLEHMDYGSHEYSARDLEGNLWSFGTYRP